MKNTILCISLMIISVSAAAQQYPLKNIYNVEVRHCWGYRKDSVLYYTITSIDSIVPHGDTIFKKDFFAEGWQFRHDTLYEHRQDKYQNGGYVMNGKKEGLWDISNPPKLFDEGTYRHELAYYYRNEFIAHWYDDPIHPFNKYYFLDDTICFSVDGYHKDYVLKMYSADTMYFKITTDDCFFYIDDVLVDTMKLRDLNSILRVDIYGGWNTRKYKMIRDSVKNTKNYK
ncbi:MAG: hypothetical protein IJ911_08010 [Salinivirgaceae bacterium]|nr:hypothetical protein [Salinivirgaceae bacterium]